MFVADEYLTVINLPCCFVGTTSATTYFALESFYIFAEARVSLFLLAVDGRGICWR
jgi:hypothetical protein